MDHASSRKHIHTPSSLTTNAASQPSNKSVKVTKTTDRKPKIPGTKSAARLSVAWVSLHLPSHEGQAKPVCVRSGALHFHNYVKPNQHHHDALHKEQINYGSSIAF